MSPNVVAQFTTFTVAEHDDPLAMDNGSQIGEDWKEIIWPLVKTGSPLQCMWSREREDPQRILIVTVWQTAEALEKFENGEAGRSFYQALTERCVAPPTTILVDFATAPFYTNLAGYTEIVQAHWTPDSYEAHKQDADALLGITNRFGGNFRARGLYRRHPCCGNVTGQAGQVTKVFCHYWVDEITEIKFKSDTDRTITGSQHEHWHDQLRAAGAVAWEERHYDFATVPSMFREEYMDV